MMLRKYGAIVLMASMLLALAEAAETKPTIPAPADGAKKTDTTGEARLSLPAAPVALNQAFVVPAVIDVGKQVLGAYSLVLAYDPQVLRCDAVSPASSALGEPFLLRIDNEKGTVFFSDMNAGMDKSITGSLTVAQVKFTAIGKAGSSCKVTGTLKALGEATFPSKRIGAPTPRALVGGGTVKIAGAAQAGGGKDTSKE